MSKGQISTPPLRGEPWTLDLGLWTNPREHGVALVVTVILISVITFLTITFLAISRREKGAVTTATDQTIWYFPQLLEGMEGPSK